jgi:L-fuconolactonase
MLIDAHQHFWRLSERAGYWPPAELAAIYRDFAPADLEPLLRENGVRGTVLVQTLPKVEDTDWMLDLAARHDFILGVVGWVDLASADAPASIARLARNVKFKGLRPMLQDLADPHWIEDPALDAGVAAMLEHGLSFDALVLPGHLGPLLRFAERHPELPIVIDHAAKPLIAQGAFEPWLSDMRRLAALPQVCCKLSGMLTETGLPHASPDGQQAVAPYAEAVIDLFAADRLIWGSDWPVLRLASDYTTWLNMARALLAALPAEQQAAVLGGNALRFYRLDVPLADTGALDSKQEKA